MIWLYLIGGLHILGFGFTITRLAYDEWQQLRASKMTPAAKEDRHSEVEYATWKPATT
jgi:hypothetical protein